MRGRVGSDSMAGSFATRDAPYVWLIGDRYELAELLGEGGLAVVHRAQIGRWGARSRSSA